MYINKLTDFQVKSAEIESISLIRSLRVKFRFPVKAEDVDNYFAEFLVTDADKAVIETGLNTLPGTIQKVKALLQTEDPIYEKINLVRTLNLVEGFVEPLFNNLNYASEIAGWYPQFISETTAVVNAMPKLYRREDKIPHLQKIDSTFQKILRNDQLMFNTQGVVYEKEVNEITGLLNGIEKGYFFHITLEEEIQKLNFSKIKARIAPEELQLADEIEANLRIIMKGIKAAYDMNMRMVNCALHLYAWVKWTMNP